MKSSKFLNVVSAASCRQVFAKIDLCESVGKIAREAVDEVLRIKPVLCQSKVECLGGLLQT